MKINTRGFEFSFVWLFAIIVGIAIIFLAIYASTNLIKTERTIIDTETGKKLGVLLNPIETDLESAKHVTISFAKATRVFNSCFESSRDRKFGKQEISTAVRLGIGEEWQSPGVPSAFQNKYLFSKNTLEGKEIFVFAKPFKMPFKVADLLFAWTDQYCFVNPPNGIEEDITSLNLPRINITTSPSLCSSNSEIVCFSSATEECSIKVFQDSKRIRKNGLDLYYEDNTVNFGENPNALIYGAIFADPGIYECQVNRLLARTSELSNVYIDKTEFLSSRGCASNLAADLRTFSEISKISSSRQLQTIKLTAEQLERRNDGLSCKLF